MPVDGRGELPYGNLAPADGVGGWESRPGEFRSCTCVVRFAFLSRDRILKEVAFVDMRCYIGHAEAGLTQRLLFDNSVDCIRQPKRRRDKYEIRRVNNP